MRVVIHDFGGYPFSVQLAWALAARGYEMHYLHAAGFKTPRGAVSSDGGSARLVHFRGIDPGLRYRSDAGLDRLRHERRYGSLLADAIQVIKPDVVVSANCPLDAQSRALDATHRSGASFVFWLQDIYALAVGQLLRRRLGLFGSLVGARFARLERRLLRESDAVITITEDFNQVLGEWRVPSRQVTVIENWAPLTDKAAVEQGAAWRRRNGLSDAPLLLYAGTLGRKHDPLLLIEVARGLPRATVAVVSEGTGTRYLAGISIPNNLRLLPLQPAHDVPSMLAASDILIAILDADAHQFSVPSKVLAYLAAGRPILAAMPQSNLAARTIRQAHAGVVVDPLDRSGLVRAARDLLEHPERRDAYGRHARDFAERTFDIDAKADEFEAVLRQIATRSHAQPMSKADTA